MMPPVSRSSEIFVLPHHVLFGPRLVLIPISSDSIYMVGGKCLIEALIGDIVPARRAESCLVVSSMVFELAFPPEPLESRHLGLYYLRIAL